jgi:hypothetical protein
MTNVDMMVAEISGSEVVLGDFQSVGFSMPSKDTSQDIKLINQTI